MQRVGVIGLGPIGNRHARIYSGMAGARLVAVCDIVVAAEQAVFSFSETVFSDRGNSTNSRHCNLCYLTWQQKSAQQDPALDRYSKVY